MAYYINKIVRNVYNHYKYHYLDHMVSVIDIRDNYWAFNVDLYCINDFCLPINSLAANLQLPYQQVQDLAFNLNSDQSKAQAGVEHNKEYAHIYSSAFNVDISQNEYLKQDLTNIKLDMELSLFIDPEAAKGAGDAIKQEDLDPLMNETSEQRWNFEMFYTNTHLINQSKVIDNVVSYTLPFGHECIATTKTLRFSSDLLLDLNHPFNNLTKVSSTTNFQVLVGKVKFTYWIDSSLESKTIEKQLQLDPSLTSSMVIDLNDGTKFDEQNNCVVFDRLGVPGFYIPKCSHGYYELELHIMQEGTINKFIVNNNFNFETYQQIAFISIASKELTSQEDWRWVIYD